MIAEKAADMIRDVNTVERIQEYFRHLIEIKHDKLKDEEEEELLANKPNKNKKK